jgi:polynucleotide 5'-kinase involved in rRNA processing
MYLSASSTGAPPTAKKGRIDLAAVQKARAVEFLAAIMADLVARMITARAEPVYGSGTLRITPLISLCFDWNQLLKRLAVEDVNTPKRVAAVGTPGIGKSTTASFAVRLLLQRGKTVVYLHRTVDVVTPNAVPGVSIFHLKLEKELLA